MAEYELIEERIISGQGLLRVPIDKVKNRYSVLFLDVIRFPRNAYINRNWNPPRGKYAFLTFVRDTYVIDSKAMEFPSEAYDGIADMAGQTLIAVKCAYQGTLESFRNLTLGLAGTPGGQGLVYLGMTNLIEDYENLNLAWNEVKIKCYADTAVQARLYRLQYDTCDPDYDKQRQPPPPPPPRDPVPPGTPIDDISEPYDPGSNDGGDSTPFPGDEFPPPFEPLPDNTLLRWNLSTNRIPRTTYAQAVFSTFTPVSNYTLTQGNTDVGANAREWLASFVSGTTTVTGSAVGNLNPEDKPSLYLWRDGVTDEPWQIIPPP